MEHSQHMRAHDLTVAGQRIHFWKGGTGPGLLLLHAAWGDAEMSWSPVWDQLARANTIVAPDLPGFGRSSALSRPSLPAMAGTIKGLLETLQVDAAMVVGNSFGAGVAIQFANDHPKTAPVVVLVNGGYMPVMPGLVRRLIALPLLNRGFRSLIRMLTFSPAVLKRSFADPSRLPPDFFERIRERALDYSRISFDTIMNLSEPLTQPPAPTFLVWGAQDGFATLKQAQAILRSMPGAELITIEGAGHMPQVERPQKFIEAIRAAAGTDRRS